MLKSKTIYLFDQRELQLLAIAVEWQGVQSYYNLKREGNPKYNVHPVIKLSTSCRSVIQSARKQRLGRTTQLS
jgi:hypothetical protein